MLGVAELEQYVTGWESQRVHRGGLRGGLSRRSEVFAEAPLHAVRVGEDRAVCGVLMPFTDEGQPWSADGMGRCHRCRAQID